jgi:hypothetical protein
MEHLKSRAQANPMKVHTSVDRSLRNQIHAGGIFSGLHLRTNKAGNTRGGSGCKGGYALRNEETDGESVPHARSGDQIDKTEFWSKRAPLVSTS